MRKRIYLINDDTALILWTTFDTFFMQYLWILLSAFCFLLQKTNVLLLLYERWFTELRFFGLLSSSSGTVFNYQACCDQNTTQLIKDRDASVVWLHHLCSCLLFWHFDLSICTWRNITMCSDISLRWTNQTMPILATFFLNQVWTFKPIIMDIFVNVAPEE